MASKFAGGTYMYGGCHITLDLDGIDVFLQLIPPKGRGRWSDPIWANFTVEELRGIKTALGIFLGDVDKAEAERDQP